jgi:cbb3-type cytochrome oxidase maturation protein
MLVSTYFLIFISLLFSLIFVAAFIWAVKSGQFTDIEEPKYQMMRDDDDNIIDDDQK